MGLSRKAQGQGQPLAGSRALCSAWKSKGCSCFSASHLGNSSTWLVPERSGGREIAQCLKCSLRKCGDLSSIPQSPLIKPDMMVRAYNPNAGEVGTGRALGPHWPTSLTKAMRPRFQGESISKEKKKQKTKVDESLNPTERTTSS